MPSPPSVLFLIDPTHTVSINPSINPATPHRPRDHKYHIDYKCTDKRGKDKFKTLPFCTYPRPTSGISSSHKLNIICSEFCVYSKLCNRRKYFVYCASLLIYEFWRLGYKFAPLFNKAFFVLRKLVPLYGVSSALLLIQQIYWRVVLFCRTGVAYRDFGVSAQYAIDPFTMPTASF
jgi:hypothetical protein